MSPRYPPLVRLVGPLCALVSSPGDGFIRVVRFAWVYLVLPSRFSENDFLFTSIHSTSMQVVLFVFGFVLGPLSNRPEART